MNSPQLFKRGTTSPLASTHKGELPKCWEERSHKSTSRSVDASWGTPCVGRTEKGWAGTRCKRENPCDRGGHSARGIDLKALTRGPRHATSDLHQDSFNVTGGVGLLEKFSLTALPSGEAALTSYPSGPFPVLRYSRLGCMHFDTPGPRVGRAGLTVASMRDRFKRRYAGPREPLPTMWVE